MELAPIGLGVMRALKLFLAAAGISATHWLLMRACISLSILGAGITVPIATSFIVVALTVVALIIPGTPDHLKRFQMAAAGCRIQSILCIDARYPR